MSGSVFFHSREKIFVGGERPNAGGIGIRALRGSGLQCVRTSHSQTRQRSRPTIPHDPVVVPESCETRRQYWQQNSPVVVIASTMRFAGQSR
jgi:hypothetical protein